MCPVSVHVGMARVDAALDAEVTALTSPLELVPAARRLTVIVPPDGAAG